METNRNDFELRKASYEDGILSVEFFLTTTIYRFEDEVFAYLYEGKRGKDPQQTLPFPENKVEFAD